VSAQRKLHHELIFTINLDVTKIGSLMILDAYASGINFGPLKLEAFKSVKLTFHGVSQSSDNQYKHGQGDLETSGKESVSSSRLFKSPLISKKALLVL
jgi:hypothetical protein